MKISLLSDTVFVIVLEERGNERRISRFGESYGDFLVIAIPSDFHCRLTGDDRPEVRLLSLMNVDIGDGLEESKGTDQFYLSGDLRVVFTSVVNLPSLICVGLAAIPIAGSRRDKCSSLRRTDSSDAVCRDRRLR